MLDRRDFLAKSMGAGAVLAVVGLGGAQTAFAGTAIPHRYGVGQVVPPIVGIDQYNATARLTKYRGSWSIIDLCPWWCFPCNESAVRHAEFSQYLRANGVPFHFFSVVVDDQSFRPSKRHDAERWAETFGLCRDIVLHCNGDAQSPLRNLVSLFAAGNGNHDPGYPTYVLVDPLGVVRYYQAGADLNQLQAQVAAFTGANLTHTWALGTPPPAPTSRLAAAIKVTGKLTDGTVVNQVVETDSLDSGLILVGPDVFPLDGFSGAVTTTTALGFDPDTPFALTFSPTTPPVASPFTRLVSVGDELAFAPDDAIDFSQQPPSVDPFKVVQANPIISNGPDGVTVTAPSITSMLGSRPDNQWSTMWFVDTVNSQTPDRWSMAYSLAQTLIADVAASTLSATVQTRVTAQLTSILGSIRARNFKAATTTATAAATKLRAGAADLAIQADADWLASHLAAIAAQT